MVVFSIGIAVPAVRVISWRSPFLERTISGLSIGLLSIQLALSMLTLTLFASYDGSLVASEIPFRQAGFE